MNRIIISVTNDLVTDQRVKKTCDCFNELGYDILLIGRKMKDSLDVKREYSTFRFRLLFNKGFFFYAEYNLRLFFKLLFLKKDLLMANDLDTLMPNFLISRLSSKKLIYDSHELFTEVPELISRPLVRSFWLEMEKLLFPRLKNVMTVSEKIAEIYQKKYHVPVTTIKNVPITDYIYEQADFPFIRKGKKIIVYQGAINIGRGLELMIDTMPRLPNYLFLIVGDGDIHHQLKKQVSELNLEESVVFLGKVPLEKLVNYTKIGDLGISLEEDMGLNYRYSLPNKIFDYVQTKIPVLAAKLPMTTTLFEQFKIGELLEERTPEKLAFLIEKIISEKESYTEELNKAALFYNWDNEKKRLIEFIQNIE